MAEKAGADAIGIVVCSDSPRNVSLETASEILAHLGPFTAGICVTHTKSGEEFQSIIDLHPSGVQVSYPFIQPAGTGVKIIRVVESGVELPHNCDAVVIDESRGSGRLFSPGFAKCAVRESEVPVILAGGLNPDNVKGAIDDIHPYAVDVASGVEISPGVKDTDLVYRFIYNAKGH
jgi:phosphoribosylanthranilate isomerase